MLTNKEKLEQFLCAHLFNDSAQKEHLFSDEFLLKRDGLSPAAQNVEGMRLDAVELFQFRIHTFHSEGIRDAFFIGGLDTEERLSRQMERDHRFFSSYDELYKSVGDLVDNYEKPEDQEICDRDMDWIKNIVMPSLCKMAAHIELTAEGERNSLSKSISQKLGIEPLRGGRLAFLDKPIGDNAKIVTLAYSPRDDFTHKIEVIADQVRADIDMSHAHVQ